MNIIIDEVKDKKKRGRKPKNVEDNMVEQPIVEKKKGGVNPNLKMKMIMKLRYLRNVVVNH